MAKHFYISSPKLMSPVTSNKNIKVKKYKQGYDDNALIKTALEWYKTSHSFRAFCRANREIPKNTLQRHIKQSTLFEMKERKESQGRAAAVFQNYLKQLSVNVHIRTDVAHDFNRYLTNDEELQLVELLRIMSAMGFGIARHEAAAIIDTIVNHDEPEVAHTACSEHVLRLIFKKYPDLQTTSAASLDPLRAVKATVEVRDAMFAKMEAYIKVLNAAHKVSWESYQLIPKNCIYNMDEVGTDTTKHRAKIIGSTLNSIVRPFQRTPEGDGKMNVHVTCCLTTCADGEFTTCCVIVIWLIVVVVLWLIVVGVMSKIVTCSFC
jgi:hypothetical protein